MRRGVLISWIVPSPQSGEGARRADEVPSYASVAKRGVGIALMSRQEFQTRNLVLWAKSSYFGRMFWFILKMLVGSYFRFTTWSL